MEGTACNFDSNVNCVRAIKLQHFVDRVHVHDAFGGSTLIRQLLARPRASRREATSASESPSVTVFLNTKRRDDTHLNLWDSPPRYRQSRHALQCEQCGAWRQPADTPTRRATAAFKSYNRTFELCIQIST